MGAERSLQEPKGGPARRTPRPQCGPTQQNDSCALHRRSGEGCWPPKAPRQPMQTHGRETQRPTQALALCTLLSPTPTQTQPWAKERESSTSHTLESWPGNHTWPSARKLRHCGSLTSLRLSLSSVRGRQFLPDAIQFSGLIKSMEELYVLSHLSLSKPLRDKNYYIICLRDKETKAQKDLQQNKPGLGLSGWSDWNPPHLTPGPPWVSRE